MVQGGETTMSALPLTYRLHRLRCPLRLVDMHRARGVLVYHLSFYF